MSESKPDFLDEMQQPDEVETPAEPDTTEATPTAETVETPAPEAEPEAPTAPEADKGSVPLAALMAERDKRQNEQRQREALQRELDRLKAEREQPPSFYDNPESHVQHIVTRAQQDAQQRLFAALEADVRDQHPDYDEVFEEVVKHAEQNPAIRDQVFNSPNPARAAYKLGKQLRELAAMQDPEAYRQKLEAELRAKWEAEQAAKAKAKQDAAAQIPPDLSTARNATAATTPSAGSVIDELFPR